MKKAKRPRRPSVPKVRILKRKPQAPLFTEADAAIFDLVKPPDGITYQWVAIEDLPRLPKGMHTGNWAKVPFSEHSDLPEHLNFDGCIVYIGNILMRRTSAAHEATLEGPRKEAVEQNNRYFEAMGFELPSAQNGRPRSVHYILAQSHVVSEPYDTVPFGPDVIVDVTIPMRLSHRFQDIAAALHLTPDEYARRRVLLHVQGQIDGLLMPVDGAFDLIEKTFTLQQREF